MQRIGISTLALAIGLVAAPRVQAQSRVLAQTSSSLVCRDGQVVSSVYGARACDRHGGVDATATARLRSRAVARSNRTNGNRTVYNGSTNGNRAIYNGGTTNGTRGVYRGGTNGSVNNGSVYNGGVYNGTVNGRRSDQSQVNGQYSHRHDDNDADDHGKKGNGHAYGHDKKDHHDNGRRGHD
jgi:hypothetical protein